MAGGGGGGRPSDRVRAITIQSTIQSIKEVVGGHSDADIYAALRESNMDPNETAQKLLNQDPFHEVKRKRDKKRANACHKSSAVTRERVEQTARWTKSQIQWIQNEQRAYNQNRSPDAGPIQEFRIVRDHRFQHGAVDGRPEPGHKSSANVQLLYKSEAVVQSDRKHFPAMGSESSDVHYGAKSSSNPELLQAKRGFQGSPQKHMKPYTKNSLNERHTSTSDPVPVPSSNFKAAIAVGTIRQQVGVVNVPRQPSGQSGLQLHASSGSSHGNFQREKFTSMVSSGRHSTSMLRNTQANQRSALGSAFHGQSIGRSSIVAQNINKYRQGAASNQKAMQPNKEWKPKLIKNPSNINVDSSGANLLPPSATNTGSANVIDVINISDKISQANIHEVEHVIIPVHIRVPDHEQIRLKFGSFTPGFDSNQVQGPASSESENSEHPQELGQLVPRLDLVGAEHDEVDKQARSSEEDPSTSTAQIFISPSEDSEHTNNQEVENEEGLGLVQSDTPLLVAPDARNIQNTPNLPTFSAYEDPQANNDVQLYGLVEPNLHSQGLASSSQAYPSENPEANNDLQMFRMPEHNVHPQALPSTSEALSSQFTSSSPTVISSQQQQLSQPQPATQLYPPVHVPHFPNFMPYRHVYSPVYVPPMAVPNYSTNIAYPHPSNGNNYLQMPGGSSHLTAGGMKYGVSQYKSVPAGNPSGYGNYTHPAGFTISSPGVIGGAVGLDDVNRVKYKENSLYASAPQVETSDIWIQTPREIPTLHSPPYYSLTGPATPGAFVGNPGNASFSATAQSSHAQFPGLYHPQQPPSIVSPHHVVHQQVPSAIGANVGVGVAAPAPQVGGYQQPQLGHLNWRANF